MVQMAAAQPDTPGSTPRKEEHKSRAEFGQNGHGTDLGQEDAHSDQGYDRPDQTVFDLTMVSQRPPLACLGLRSMRRI